MHHSTATHVVRRPKHSLYAAAIRSVRAQPSSGASAAPPNGRHAHGSAHHCRVQLHGCRLPEARARRVASQLRRRVAPTRREQRSQLQRGADALAAAAVMHVRRHATSAPRFNLEASVRRADCIRRLTVQWPRWRRRAAALRCSYRAACGSHLSTAGHVARSRKRIRVPPARLRAAKPRANCACSAPAQQRRMGGVRAASCARDLCARQRGG